MALPSLLIPPVSPTAAGAAHARDRLRRLLEGVDAALVFVADWRTPAPQASSAHLEAVPGELARHLAAALAEATLFPAPPAPPPPLDLALLPAGLPVLPLSVPLLGPELLVELGAAAAEAGRASGRRLAVVAQGYVGGRRATAEARRRFDDEVVHLFAQGRGHQLPNLDPERWLAAHPHQDLAHLFVLLGSAGGTAEGELIGRWEDPGGSAVVLYLRPDRTPPAAVIPVRPVGHEG